VVLAIPNQESVSPFWWYFFDANANPLAPITLLWTVAMLVTWVRFPRHMVTWFTLPFFLGHSIFPHKEVRYLFPIALLSTFFFILAYVPQSGAATQPAWLRAIWQRRKSWLAMVLCGLNIVGLIYGCVAAKQPSVNFQKYVYDHYPHGCTLCLLGADTKSPYENVGLNMFFYRPPGFTIERVHGTDELESLMRTSPRDVLVVRDRVSAWPDEQSVTPTPRLIYRTYPPWVESYNYFGWLQHSKRFSLYAVETRSQTGGKGTSAANAKSTASRTASRIEQPDNDISHE
jgi:phosphatidylinositol glycan class B